ncbi:MAG: sensor histidine kinase [Gemmatimonadaceae bacterium]
MAEIGASNDIYGIVLIARLRAPIEPLFARHARVWLRVWAAMQLVALAAATWTVAKRAGSLEAVFLGVNGTKLGLALSLLVAWHVAGFARYDWLVRERWRSVLFVAGCVASIAWASAYEREYTYLVLGVLFQTCVFLSFPWILAALIAAVAVNALALAGLTGGAGNVNILNAVPILVFGVAVGTVVLYIHRSNRDATVQEDLLRRLDAAQHDLAARSREAGVLEERQRLSRDLHDTLAQDFTSIVAQLSAAELALYAPTETADAEVAAHRLVLAAPYLARAQEVSRASLTEIRQLVLALRPTALADNPLPAALQRVVREWSSLHGIDASFEALDVPALVQDAEVMLLRATQEGLVNIARHASASRVDVRLSCVDDLLLLEIDDDGIGITEVASERGGLGLAGMRERAVALGGRMIIDTSPNIGTSITLALPLAPVTAPPNPQRTPTT